MRRGVVFSVFKNTHVPAPRVIRYVPLATRGRYTAMTNVRVISYAARSRRERTLLLLTDKSQTDCFNWLQFIFLFKCVS